MAPGQAYGKNRDYQVLVRDILQTKEPDLKPFSGDGIDVAFKLGWMKSSTFDVALKGSGNRIVVAECRRWGSKYRIKQDDILAFARKVELLRQKSLRVKVAGLYFTTSNYQQGALSQAAYEGIQVITCPQDQAPPEFALTYHKYDKERDKYINDSLVNLIGSFKSSGSLSIQVIRGDGTVEDLGKVD
jgi:hypothetical protein